jgi:hypothetical protein
MDEPLVGGRREERTESQNQTPIRMAPCGRREERVKEERVRTVNPNAYGPLREERGV